MVRCDNRTKAVAVPFIGLADGVEVGEELILEVNSRAKEKKKRTWREVAREEENELKRDFTKAQRARENGDFPT